MEQTTTSNLSQILQTFLTSSNGKELMFCFLFCIVALSLPKLMFWGRPTKRPIPKQETSAGDMLVDLRLDNELVSHETVSGTKKKTKQKSKYTQKFTHHF